MRTDISGALSGSSVSEQSAKELSFKQRICGKESPETRIKRTKQDSPVLLTTLGNMDFFAKNGTRMRTDISGADTVLFL